MMNKYVTIKADKERHLRFNFNALMILEENLDKPVTELGNSISFKDINTLVWAGLLHEEPGLTKEDTAEIIDAVIENEGINSLSNKLALAVTMAFGGGKKKGKK